MDYIILDGVSRPIHRARFRMGGGGPQGGFDFGNCPEGMVQRIISYSVKTKATGRYDVNIFPRHVADIPEDDRLDSRLVRARKGVTRLRNHKAVERGKGWGDSHPGKPIWVDITHGDDNTSGEIRYITIPDPNGGSR